MWSRISRLRQLLATVRDVKACGNGRPNRLRGLGPTSNWKHVRWSSNGVPGTGDHVKFGTLKIETPPPESPWLVSQIYSKDAKLVPTALEHLRWMAQKTKLGQDVFLLGPPGPQKRQLALLLCSILNREYEYVAITRDTTESDLKQRKEIQKGSTRFVDQGVIEAALHGRILIIDGIEKAERNVLPVLNNLLENREMQLEDGRFLMHPTRYDELLEKYGNEKLDAMQIVRVHPDFVVVGLGIPVPTFPGHPLDPPLRSRFQCRHVGPLPYSELIQQTESLVSPGLGGIASKQLCSWAYSLLSEEWKVMGLPHFPSGSIPAALKLMNNIGDHEAVHIIHRLYPWELFPVMREGPSKDRKSKGNAEVHPVVQSLEKFGFSPTSSAWREIVGVKSVSDTEADVTVQKDGSSCTFRVPIGSQTLGAVEDIEDFVATPSLTNLLAEMAETHSVHDLCLVGPQGCGKTVVTHEFARILGYDVEPVVMFQDMTARDLTQQRGTGPDGDTYWRLSPLVSAVLNGRLAVLDGIHRVHASTLNVLHRLLHEREMHLHDGRRILNPESYDSLKEQLNAADEDMAAKGILRAHPSFRMIALGEASPGSSTQRKTTGSWLNAEILSMFMFHQFPESSWAERLKIITELYGKPDASMYKIMKLSQLLSESKDPVRKSLGSSLSFRQLLRAARILKHHPDESGVELVHRACLRKFLPISAREVLDEAMAEVGLVEPSAGSTIETPEWELGGGKLKIGRVEIAVKDPESVAKVPYSQFFDIRQQLIALEGMLSDFILGEHLLLIGNQGVGKNRLADRMLNLLSRPREYIQLHRDTTVSSLTVQPTVKEGVVTYEDSPLVTAVKKGYVLVVDEADKAPTQVTCILKTLVEEGEMVLSDGRRIVPAHSETDDPNAIKIHPDFRMIVLANRPGFPFLGNDFYAVLGDIFSCHVIDNPDLESEMSLLGQYGPDVPKHVLLPLAKAFQDLRRSADEGVLPYPYSTREAVAVVKHLQSFPDDGLNEALRNVFDFEAYSKENMETVTTILSRHGIPIASTAASVNLAEEKSLPDPTVIGSWTILRDTRKKLPRQHRPLRVKGPVQVESASAVLDRVESRITGFSEETAYWQMPITAYDNVNDMTTFSDGNETLVYAATAYPPSVYEMNLSSGQVSALRIRKALGNAAVYSSNKKFSLQPLPLVSGGGGPLLLLHDAETNSLNLVDPKSREITRLLTSTTTEAVSDGMISSFFKSKPAANFKMVPLDGTCELSLFEPGGQSLGFVNAEQRVYSEVSVPFALRNVFPLDEDTWLLVDGKRRKYYLSKCHSNTVAGYYVEEIASHFRGPCLDVEQISVEGLSDEHLHSALREKLSCPNSIVATTESYADLIIGFPQLKASPNEIYRFPRPTPLNFSNDRHKTVMLPHQGLVVRALPPDLHGSAMGRARENLSGMLEVVNLPANTVKTIPVKAGSYAAETWQDTRKVTPELWIDRVNDVSVDEDGGDLVSLDNSGCLRLWQIQPERVRTALSKWHDLVGRNSGETEAPQVTIHRANWRDLSGPKHGKIDPKNVPHVGGNTWAGGTGGRDTAGLGGRGGPYRLDAGHPVFQVSDAEKAAVPPEVLAAAREIAVETFKKRMAEINMDPLDVQMYQQFISRIEPDIKKLRAVISSLQAKDQERQWVKLQTHGDLDDTRIVEGLTGEKTIYRRRADKEPELGAPQEKPKHIRLVVDVSGSMYRFNGYDGRLIREQEAVLLMMEAFQGTGDKIRYDITGHSGDTESISFIEHSSPPANAKDRFKVLQLMEAHSQFCFSGDNSINAIERAVREVSSMENVDEKFVVVLSDANLQRYGISPRRLSQAIASQPDVNVTAVFIGSLGPQAEVLKQALPAGRGYVCMDTKQLPHIMQQIFASSLLR